MNASSRVLLFGGLALAAFSMFYGVYYALFVEHQKLDGMGSSLTTSFVRAAERREPESQAAMESYVVTKFEYVRQVDSHSHWIGLAMLMIVLGAAFDAVAFREPLRLILAGGLLAGSVLFPLGVILQTVDRGPGARALAIAGSGLVIASLAGMALGFAKSGVD